MKLTIEQLKQVANKLDFSYHHAIGVDKLYAQLTEHCNNLNTTIDKVLEDIMKDTQDKDIDPYIDKLSKLTFADLDKMSAVDNLASTDKRALELVRCIISCNNPNKKSYQGEILTARNKFIPEVKKFIQFNSPTHIPRILFNMIKEKQLQMFKKERVNGNVVTRSFLVSEYNIQLLDPLTSEEFEAIKQKQLAEGRT